MNTLASTPALTGIWLSDREDILRLADAGIHFSILGRGSGGDFVIRFMHELTDTNVAQLDAVLAGSWQEIPGDVTP